MKKTLFTVIALLLTSACLLCGCKTISTGNEAPKVVFFDSGYQQDEQQIAVFGKASNGSELPVICIESKSAMDEFNQRAKENFYMTEGNEETTELPTVSDYNDVVSPYTEEFFKEKALVVCFACTGNSLSLFEISDISIENNKLTVCVETMAMSSDYGMEGRFVFVEIPKNDLKGVTEFSAILNSEAIV